MAGQNRRDIFDPNEVGAFHAVQRTVRRAWLYGTVVVSKPPNFCPNASLLGPVPARDSLGRTDASRLKIASRKHPSVCQRWSIGFSRLQFPV